MLFELVFYPVQGGMSKRMIMCSETMQCSLLLVLQECGAINAQPSSPQTLKLGSGLVSILLTKTLLLVEHWLFRLGR